MLGKSLKRVGLSWLLVAGCSDGTGPALPPCLPGAGLAATLAPGEYLAFDPGPNSGCVTFLANAATVDSAEYLVVPQLATGEPGRTSSFRLTGAPGAPGAPLAAPAAAAPRALSGAEQFHAFLRRAEAARWYGEPPEDAGAPALRAPELRAGPPVEGTQRQFSVLSSLEPLRFTRVTATAKTVGRHIAIYVDDAAPPGGLTQQDLDELTTLFDTRLYGVDTTAFGRESDVDDNAVVIVLMTPVVNRLVTRAECDATNQFIAGFFFAFDIDPLFARDSRSNRSEVFYSIVADPGATVSCAHSVGEVQAVTPTVFVHELQHMISFNQHVLVRNGDSEVLWLNEGLSHFAEELAGRTYPLGSPDFSRFVIGNLINAYQYLDATGSHFLLPTEGIGSQAERGAAWLYVRYLVDQYGSDLPRKLVQTTALGAANVAVQTGVAFEVSVTRWALANFVSDLDTVPGFTAPPQLQYTSWDFRTTYESLHMQNSGFFPKPFPLTPSASAGELVNLRGTLRAGSGVYHRALQGPRATGFTLLFGAAGGGLLGTARVEPLPDKIVPRLNIIRIR